MGIYSFKQYRCLQIPQERRRSTCPRFYFVHIINITNQKNMKKVIFIYAQFLLIVACFVGFTSCGDDDGDSSERIETDLEKFYRLSGVNKDDFVLWKQGNFSSSVGSDYLVFSALRKLGSTNYNMFHLWVFNKNTNKIVTCSDKIETVYTDSYDKLTYHLSSYDNAAYDVYLKNARGGEVIDIIFYYKVGTTNYGKASKCFWFNNNENEELTYIDGNKVSTLSKKSSILEWYNNTIAVSCSNASAIIDVNGSIIKTLPNDLDKYVNPELKKVYYYLETYDYDKGLELNLNNKGSVYKPKYYIQVEFLDFSLNYPKNEQVLFDNYQITNPYDVDYSIEIISSNEVNCTVRLIKKESQENSTYYTIEINKQEKTATCKKE